MITGRTGSFPAPCSFPDRGASPPTRRRRSRPASPAMATRTRPSSCPTARRSRSTSTKTCSRSPSTGAESSAPAAIPRRPRSRTRREGEDEGRVLRLVPRSLQDLPFRELHEGARRRALRGHPEGRLRARSARTATARTTSRARPPRTKVSDTCGACHSDIAEVFGKSVHGLALAQGNQDVPVCVDCHRAHDIADPKTTSWRLKTSTRARSATRTRP